MGWLGSCPNMLHPGKLTAGTHGGLVQMIFLCKWVIFRFKMLHSLKLTARTWKVGVENEFSLQNVAKMLVSGRVIFRVVNFRGSLHFSQGVTSFQPSDISDCKGSPFWPFAEMLSLTTASLASIWREIPSPIQTPWKEKVKLLGGNHLSFYVLPKSWKVGFWISEYLSNMVFIRRLIITWSSSFTIQIKSSNRHSYQTISNLWLQSKLAQRPNTKKKSWPSTQLMVLHFSLLARLIVMHAEVHSLPDLFFPAKRWNLSLDSSVSWSKNRSCFFLVNNLANFSESCYAAMLTA